MLAFSASSSNAAFVHVFTESLDVVTVMVFDELFDAPGSILPFCLDFVEPPEVSARDTDSLFVFVGCVFAMMHTFLTIKFDPSFSKGFLVALRLAEHPKNT